ncbi:MAG: patatin family protein [Treponema sp.]|nr:patatin family protein [Treponema sp.]
MGTAKTGIVIEGGGHRGIYSAGVLDVLRENNIIVDGIIGVSAGAVHGASYASGQAGRSIRYTEKYCRDKRYMSARSFFSTGDLFNVQFCYHEIPDKLDPYDYDALESSSVAFYVTCTDIITGQPVYHQCRTLRGKEMLWMQGSASMPLVSRIVETDGYKLLDGGVSDSIPLSAFEHMGYIKDIVILTQPAGYKKKENPLLPLIRIAMKKYPELVHAMETRHICYNKELENAERQAADGAILLIRPSEHLKVSRTEKDPEKIRGLYNLGRKDTLAQLEEVRHFLSK